MRFSQAKVGLGIAALATILAFGTAASAAAPISKCNAAKKKCIGKYVAAVTGCHAKAEGKSLLLDPVCISKAVAKITDPIKPGCFDKADVKNDGCSNLGDAGAQLALADAFILDAVDDIDPGYPTPHTNKCDAAEKKCFGKKAAGLTGCAAKENKDGIGDPFCAPKVSAKFTDPFKPGCFDKAVTKNDGPCGPATAAGIELKTDAWVAASSAAIDSTTTCGNGLNDAGEKCDASAPSAGWATCGPDFTCTACNCACPAKIKFTGNASAPESILDTGWTGVSHRSPIVTNGTATITMSCTATSRPCGTCSVGGPVANGPGEIQNQRCNGDTAVKCTSAPGGVAGCGGGLGTCEFYFGTNLPLAAGGVSVCAVNQINGSVSGTANVETGAASTVANLTSRVYNGGGATIDNPCPRCISGLCNGGSHPGGVCVADGSVPSRPDYGSTSLDCPPLASALVATLPIDLSNATGPVTKTLSASSPNCSGDASQKCLCDTCNNAAATPCDSNADCGAGICGGKRCLGGTNNGAPCTSATSCPSGGICDRPGEPTLPSACVDDTVLTPGVLDCLDADADGEGVCTGAPIDANCSVASGHAQRGCSAGTEVVDCGGPGTCISLHRNCFLTGGFTGVANGTGNLTAVGMADVPMADTSNPTIAAVFCVGPTGASAVNIASGLPGPGRATIKGAASGHP